MYLRASFLLLRIGGVFFLFFFSKIVFFHPCAASRVVNGGVRSTGLCFAVFAHDRNRTRIFASWSAIYCVLCFRRSRPNPREPPAFVGVIFREIQSHRPSGEYSVLLGGLDPRPSAYVTICTYVCVPICVCMYVYIHLYVHSPDVHDTRCGRSVDFKRPARMHRNPPMLTSLKFVPVLLRFRLCIF